LSVIDQLTELLVVLVAAKVGAEVMARLRLPAVIGELVIGMMIGVGGLAWVSIDGGGALETLAEIGVIILLYEVGLEIQLGDMVRLGRSAMAVAIIGVATPFALGFFAVKLLGIAGGTTEIAVFIGAAMTATSVGITARVFNDLGQIRSDEAKTVIGAAVVDDILGLVILAIVAGGLGGAETMTMGSFWWLIVRVALFLTVTVALGRVLMPAILGFLRSLRVPGSFVIGVLTLALTIGIAAERLAGLSPIVGAFVAGVIIGQADQVERIQKELRPISHFFVPIFFLAVGAQVDVTVFLEPSVLIGGLVIAALAAIGKLFAGLGAPARTVRRAVIGVGMVPRGEVGLIFAALGASQLSSVVTPEAIAIVVLMVIVTTLAPPVFLARQLSVSSGADHERN
jgi:Kef-type K+ transport system membrane component KefB